MPANPCSMFESETLQFDNARALQNLYANDLKLLQSLEEKLAVKVTTRDGWLRLEGERPNIEKARKVFRELEQARQHGIQIRRHEFQYALDSVSEGSRQPLGQLAGYKVLTPARRAPIVPKSEQQLSYVQSIQAFDIVFGVGPAGTGKTYLAMAMGVDALRKEQVKRIILTRPAVEAGEALGFLPGDLREKIFPYLRPLYDALYDMLEAEEIQRYMDRGVIEIAPLAYMRGRTLNHAFVVLDEAQNTTTEQMFMFLTRLGADSKCVVTGDQTQIDLPPNKISGLIEAMHALESVPGIQFTRFTERDVVRHSLVQSIIRAYEMHRARKGTKKS
ncbi:MAG TPA: PhoH family protein [Chthoniobacterales bacterium]|jgi:phosphate starvation-inducible protein PhoH and related proteins